MTTQDVVKHLSDGMTWAQAASFIGLFCLLLAGLLAVGRCLGRFGWGLVKRYWYWAYRHRWRRPSQDGLSPRSEAALSASCLLLGIVYLLT